MPLSHTVSGLNSIIGNKYRIFKSIGEGGMSEVCEACHIEIDRPVAIETLFSEKAYQKTVIFRVYREARLARSIGHDHICPVTDIGLHNDNYFRKKISLNTLNTQEGTYGVIEQTLRKGNRCEFKWFSYSNCFCFVSNNWMFC
jgi:serine/threonine protein kinase